LLSMPGLIIKAADLVIITGWAIMGRNLGPYYTQHGTSCPIEAAKTCNTSTLVCMLPGPASIEKWRREF
jgi:hypothetical protein